MKRILSLILALCCSFSLLAQSVWEDRVYSPIIKSVKFEKQGVDFSLPVLKLSSTDQIVLRFDELSEKTRQYDYKIIHCNSDWTQSELQPQDYIDGFESGYIETHKNSINTIQRYVHYEQIFPSEAMTFKVSGNYIVKIYEDGNEDNVVMTKRFMVVEDGVSINATVKMAHLPSDQTNKQEVSVFLANKTSIPFYLPDKNLKVIVQQNGRQDNISLLKLHQYTNNQLEYSYDQSNIFEAGNEFRAFDFTSLRIRSQYINNLDFENGDNYVRLHPVADRSRLVYTYQGDINGYYYIRNDIDEKYDLTSDYAWVCFYLQTDKKPNGNFYVWGELSNWQCNEQNKMQYDERLHCYTAQMYLKQGFYNYMFMFKPSNDSPLFNLATVEGNHSEANNFYNIFVYYRKSGDFYDSLIGYTQIEYK